MGKHTREPWNTGEDEIGVTIIRTDAKNPCSIAELCDGLPGDHVERDANAARIVACVNACAGIANPDAIPLIVAALRALCAYVTNDEEARTALAALDGGEKE